jgi:hypothetical protein
MKVSQHPAVVRARARVERATRIWKAAVVREVRLEGRLEIAVDKTDRIQGRKRAAESVLRLPRPRRARRGRAMAKEAWLWIVLGLIWGAIAFFQADMARMRLEQYGQTSPLLVVACVITALAGAVLCVAGVLRLLGVW